MGKTRTPALLAIGVMTLTVGTTAPALGQSACVPVQGKITNTFIANGGTLGVVALAYGPKKEVKLKCGLVGQPQTIPPGADIAFIHIISCDATIATPHGPLHSSIWLYTTGNVLPPTPGVAGQVATFEEMSIPLPGGPSPTGIFAGATSDSRLFVEGAFYQTGSIDMTFEGQVCK
jgi:hypothetical protein